MTEQPTPAAPLTPEEVEREIKEIERRYRITSYSPWKDDVLTLLDIASALQAQLKTRMEDAEVCRVEMLQFIQLAATGKRRDGTYNYCREALEQQAKAILSRLYPPKP